MRRVYVLGAVCLLVLACGEETEETTDTVGVDASADVGGTDAVTPDVPAPACDPEGTTYHRDVRPLVVSHCNDCHSPVQGQVYAGETYDWSYWSDPNPDDKLAQGVSTWAPAMVADVENRTMPPWPMADGCRTIQGSRALSQADIDVFKAWRENAYCQGDEADFVDPGWTPPDTDHSDAALTLASEEAWTLPETIAQTDIHRCFRLNTTFEKDTWVSAYATTPDSPMAHHSLVYLVSPADANQVQALDDAFDGPGWGDCESGVGVNSSVITGWVPGAGKVQYPADSALLIPKGSLIVMQMHYSGVGASEEDLKDNTDQTQVHFWTFAEGEVPSQRVVFKPWSHQGFQIPLGESQTVSSTKTGPPPGSKIIGVVPHMHNIGTSIRMELNRADGGNECLARVGFTDEHKLCGVDGNESCAMWDFNWQLMYLYDEADHISVQAGDEVSIHCHFPYTNDHVGQSLGASAPANQTCTNNGECASGTCTDGKCTNPDPLVWGDYSYEEMCIAYLFYSVPYNEGATFGSCASECGGDANCFLDCILSYNTKDCKIVGQLQACGQGVCEAESQAFNQCLSDCDLENPLSCIRNSQTTPPCWDTYEDFITCTWNGIEMGACDTPSCP
jgi:hypothetical protein